MSGSSLDNWPTEYYVGPHKHLHAFGVLSTAFNSLEDRLFSLYRHHLDRLKVPYEHTEHVYLNLPDHARLNAIKEVFHLCDKDPKVIKAIENIVEYFRWCSDTRDKLSHAEFYPMAFAGKKSNAWHLTKRMSRRDSKQGYIQLELHVLRDMADKVAYGMKHCAKLQIYLRLRDIPHSELPHAYLDYAKDPLPEILSIPDFLTLSSSPEGDQ